MHILLPPSETKRSGGGSIFAPQSLSHEIELGASRIRVREALTELCADPNAATKALKLGVKSRDELEHNFRLQTSRTLPAIERYTGVLYDAIDVPLLPAYACEWLAEHLSVQSALFGLVAAHDLIPAYRLSASTRLPALGVPLKHVWSEAHSKIDYASLGWTLDLRSKDYVNLAPLSSKQGCWLNVMQREADGEIRSLNHFNKVAKGELINRLALDAPNIDDESSFIDWATGEGIEVRSSSRDGELILVVAAGEPLTPAQHPPIAMTTTR